MKKVCEKCGKDVIETTEYERCSDGTQFPVTVYECEDSPIRYFDEPYINPKNHCYHKSYTCKEVPETAQEAFSTLYRELGQLKWEGADEGWNLAVEKVRSRILEQMTDQQKQIEKNYYENASN